VRAEALLRIPDPPDRRRLAARQAFLGNWGSKKDDASFVSSAADWALMLTGTLARLARSAAGRFFIQPETIGGPARRTRRPRRHPPGDAHPRRAVRARRNHRGGRQPRQRAPALPLLVRHAGRSGAHRGGRERYFAAYSNAIRAVAPPDSVSLKLSALHPRFEETKRTRVFSELLPKLKNLTGIAAARGIGITIDAEESERLELTLDIFEALTGQFPAGLAVQAYQKRAAAVCDWLIALGRSRKRRIPMRLVKGAYWDGEIKRAQQLACPITGVHAQGGNRHILRGRAREAARGTRRDLSPRSPPTTAARWRRF